MAQQRVKTHLVVAASMGATVHGQGLNVAGFDKVSMVSTYTGTPTGAWTWEVSDDSTDGVNGTWAPWTPDKGTVTNPDGAGAGALMPVQFAPLAFQWIRPVFTRSAGTGVWDVWAFIKQNA